ncbi:MAG: hypothetical protein IH623_04645 [Verrucomicrobia bacterium]|nr:hypothetical protein [Verrucomicrobiota bacterium]
MIDRLGRPVTNAIVNIHWLESVSKDDVREVGLVKLTADSNGIVKGTYDETTIPPDEDIWVEVSKDGYSGYSTTGLQPEFVLKREFRAADLHRIATLGGAVQIAELRELLAGDFDRSGDRMDELVFVQEHRFRPALRALLPDTKVGTAAGLLLAFIGVPEDVRLVVAHAPPPKRELFEDRWAYSVACALLEPATEKEWAFLRNCAINEYEDLWVDAGGINSLKLIASSRSREILQEVEKLNSYRADYVKYAMQYIESKPPALADKDLVAAGKRVAQAIKIGNWEGNKEPRFNENRDKALVDCEFISGRDLLIHTATFHKVDGQWKLRGVRETMQVLLAHSPAREDNADEK